MGNSLYAVLGGGSVRSSGGTMSRFEGDVSGYREKVGGYSYRLCCMGVYKLGEESFM